MPFRDIDWIYWDDKGFIVWRVGTGGNIELLHIKVFKKKQGYATELVGQMVNKLKKNPPYYSIFGFALASRKDIDEIYRRLGFKVELVGNLYQKGKAFLFYQSYKNLCKKYDNS